MGKGIAYKVEITYDDGIVWVPSGEFPTREMAEGCAEGLVADTCQEYTNVRLTECLPKVMVFWEKVPRWVRLDVNP